MANEFDSFFDQAIGKEAFKINNVDLSKSDSILSEQLKKANDAYREQYGKDLPVTSAARTAAEQQSLVDRAARGEPGIFMPAKVQQGKDMYHDTAVDIGQNIPPEFAKRLETEFNLHRPFGAKDPVHWEVNPQFKQVAQANKKDQQGFDSFFDSIKPVGEQKPAVSEIAAKKLGEKSKFDVFNVSEEQKKAGEDKLTRRISNLQTLAEIPAGVAGLVSKAYMYLAEKGAEAFDMQGAYPLEKRDEIAAKISNALTPDIASRFGVDKNSPEYKDATLTKVMQYIGSNVDKGVDKISKETGLPKSDVDTFVNLIAIPGVMKGAGLAKGKIESQFAKTAETAPKVEPAFTGEKPVQAMEPQPTAAEQLTTQFEKKPIKEIKAAEASNEPLAGAEIKQAHEAKVEAQKSVPTQVPEKTAKALKEKLGETPLLPEVAQQVADAVKRGETINPDAVVLHNKARQFNIELTPGQKTLDPALISKELNERGIKEAYVARFNEQSSLLHEAANKIKTDVAPEMSAQDYVGSGEVGINQVKNIVETNQKAIKDAYKALEDAGGGKFPVDGKSIAKDAIAKLTETDRIDYLPPIIKKKLDGYLSGEKQMNFNLFENLRSDVASEMRKANRAGDGATVKALSEVRDALEKLPLTQESAPLKPLADKARSLFKADKDLESSNKLYSDVKNDVADTKTIIDNTVFRGKNADFVNTMKLFDKDPIAKQALASGALDLMIRKSTDASGNFKPAVFGKMVENLDVNRRLEPLFGRQMASKVRDLAEVSAATVARPRGSFVNESNTAVAAMNLAKNVGGSLIKSVPVLGPLAGGVGTAASVVKAFREQAKVGKSLSPGAGISTKLKDIGKK